MEALTKLIELLGKSIKSLRWWSLAVVLVGAYLRLTPEQFQPFVSQGFLAADERFEWLGLATLGASVVFLLGWCAAAIEAMFAWRRVYRARVERVIELREEHRAERRRRKAEERLTQMKQERIIRSLSEHQLSMIRLSLQQPEGILKVRNDDDLDIATLLTGNTHYIEVATYMTTQVTSAI